jgi:hypothetical protein
MTIDQIVAAINGLGENEKAELTAKLSASAQPRVQFKTLRAASADPQNHVALNVLRAHSRRLGVALEDDKPIDIVALDKALAGHHGGPGAEIYALQARLYRRLTKQFLDGEAIYLPLLRGRFESVADAVLGDRVAVGSCHFKSTRRCVAPVTTLSDERRCAHVAERRVSALILRMSPFANAEYRRQSLACRRLTANLFSTTIFYRRNPKCITCSPTIAPCRL